MQRDGYHQYRTVAEVRLQPADRFAQHSPQDCSCGANVFILEQMEQFPQAAVVTAIGDGPGKGRLDSAAHVAVIKHGPIPGWMEAMTMEYKVEENNEYRKLHVGDRITATVFVQDLDYWIGGIHAAPKK